MSQAVFVDTSAWFALAVRRDSRHPDALSTFSRLGQTKRTLLTTDYVVNETYTLLLSRAGFDKAQEFLRRIRHSEFVQRTHVPEAWEDAAEELLAQYADQDFSYVDATSFVAMKRLNLQDVFAFDHHFAILGFSVISANAK